MTKYSEIQVVKYNIIIASTWLSLYSEVNLVNINLIASICAASLHCKFNTEFKLYIILWIMTDNVGASLVILGPNIGIVSPTHFGHGCEVAE